jgi:phosphomannomutase
MPSVFPFFIGERIRVRRIMTAVMSQAEGTLQSHLTYQPMELRFGTSGRRGEVVHLTQLEVYINVCAELEYLKSIPRVKGGIGPGEEIFVASDLRPSSQSFTEDQRGRGEICQAVIRAARDCGLSPVNLGSIPTPALAYYAFSRERSSVMVTGSHIPFDRNGYKLNTSRSELLKKDEAPIAEFVRTVRERIYQQPFGASLFDQRGMFKAGHLELPRERDEARTAYIRRYTDFFHGCSLKDKRIAVYQHSAVGRDILLEILGALGSEVIPIGRSETFIPIDTENMEDSQLSAIQALVRQATEAHGPVWAVVSTDGDSDRPLVLGVNPDGTLRFFGGDLLGMIVAQFLGADAVVVPISCNDAIDRGSLKAVLEPKTRIGSPYVIEGLEKAEQKGRRRVCGWEANGGFLTGSDIGRNGHVLARLATRDAVLPILCALFAAHDEGCSLTEVFSRLPARYGRAALLRAVPQVVGRHIMARFSPADPKLVDAIFSPVVRFLDRDGCDLEVTLPRWSSLNLLRSELQNFFRPDLGFSEICRLNYLDGIRVVFSNSDVAHIRPSGNADELRIYAVADTQNRADAIARMGVEEPAGILRSMEQLVLNEAR